MRQTTARDAWYGLLWRWMALVAGLFVLDLLLGLPVWLRWVALIGQVGFILWSLRAILTRRARLWVEAERAARLVEERHPELDNALINAVQFQRSIDAVPPAQASLMRREMERAESAVSRVSVTDAVNRVPEQRALRMLAGFAGAWLLAAVLFPSGVGTVMPRLLMPWMDAGTPPFSLTRFDVRPPGATVRFGDTLAISVGVTGPLPDSLALMTRTSHTAWRRISLDSLEAGQYSVKLDALQEDTWFFVQGGGSRSARYRIRVLTPPVVKSLRVTYTYPAYTRKPPATEPLGDAGIHGLMNTGVALEISSNRPLSGGEVLIQTAGRDPQTVSPRLDPTDPSRAVARFTLVRSGIFRISLTGEDGLVNPEAARGKVTLERDERPTVWINHPGQDLLVTPEMQVPIQVEAEDDQGVQRVELHRVVNDLGDSPRGFPHAVPARHVNDTLTMDLPDLGVRPGDQITYYATAYDNDPGKPNVAETEPYKIKVVTREEYQEALKEQRAPEDVTREAGDIVSAAQQLAERQQQLAEKMERLQKQLARNPGDAGLQKQWQAARQEQKALQEEARQLAQAMGEYARSPSTSDVEQAIKNHIAQMARQMGSAAGGSMEQAQSGDPAQAARNARQAAKQLAALNHQMQQQVQKAVEHLEKIMPLYNDLERFKALLERQGQLVLRAREFQQQASAGGAARSKLEELGAEQNRIRDELKQLQQDLRLHAQACRDDFPRAARSAHRIADEIDQRQIPDLMQSGGDRFRQWKGPEGFDSAQRALAQMQAMVRDCQGGQGSSQGELDIALSRCLGQSGLGQSLAQLFGGMAPGMGNNGSGTGPGGVQAGPSGQSGGGYAVRSAKAYVPGIAAARGAAGPRRHKAQNAIAGQPAGLAPEDIDVFPSPARTPPKAGDTDSGRYPAEYRKLISDYFKSVAEKG